jgi:uncharacterized protein (TIGR02599 family)
MRHSKDNMAFTLVELMVATTILIFICMILLSMTQMISKTWTSTTGKVEQFREAREAFESITRRLSQATLNTYWDYERDGSNNPTRYIRQSELRFVSGPNIFTSNPFPSTQFNIRNHAIFFQAPLGYATNRSYEILSNMLNTWGYYIRLADDSSFWPSFINSAARTRFRLMEMSEPSDSLTLYKFTSGKDAAGDSRNSGRSGTNGYIGKDWYTVPLANAAYSRVLAKNIIALVFLPKFAAGERRSTGALFADDALAPRYTYDTTTNIVASPEINPKNQLPPVIQVTMVAIDENSAARMSITTRNLLRSRLANLFQTVGSVTDPTLPGYARDLKALQDWLVARNINYRTFTTSVSLKSAKWSREQ